MPKRIMVGSFDTTNVLNSGQHSISGIVQEIKSKSSVFAAFNPFPKSVNFDGEENDEKVILMVRAHPITNVPWILAALIANIFPIFIFPLLIKFNALPNLSMGFTFVFTVFWYLGIITYSLLHFLMWFYNVGIITDERVVDIDWNSLISRQTTMTLISKIQDVSPTQNGVLAGVFDFGTVAIQTAAEQENIEFTSIPHPQLIAKVINNLMHKEELEWEPNL